MYAVLKVDIKRKFYLSSFSQFSTDMWRLLTCHIFTPRTQEKLHKNYTQYDQLNHKIFSHQKLFKNCLKRWPRRSKKFGKRVVMEDS